MSKIYFLHAPSVGLLKVGRSSEPVRRIAAIREISPVDLDLIGVATGTSATEATIQRTFSHLRERGEWFRATPELLDYARFHCLLDLWEDLSEQAKQSARDHLFPDVPVMDRGAA